MKKSVIALILVVFLLIIISYFVFGVNGVATISVPVGEANLTGTTNAITMTYTVGDCGNNTNTTWYYRSSGVGSWTAFATNATGATGDPTNISTLTYTNNWNVVGLTDGANYQLNVTFWNRTLAGGSWCDDVTVTGLNVDNTPSNVYIDSPLNNSNYSSAGIDLNVSAADATTRAEFWWYSNNSGTTNSTTRTIGTNLTGGTQLTWDEGHNFVYVWVNDTVNNLNYTTVNFTVDTRLPKIFVDSPVNNTNYSYATININVSATDVTTSPAYYWYSNNSGTTNRTFTPNVTLTWDEGHNFVYVWVNDTVGNRNYTTTNFTVDTIKPNVTLNTPADNYSTTLNTIDFNITVKEERALYNVSLWGNWSGSWIIEQTNTSGLNGDYNFSETINTAARYEWGISACDEVNNCNYSTNRTFTITTSVVTPGGGDTHPPGSSSKSSGVYYVTPGGITKILHEGREIVIVIGSRSHKLIVRQVNSNNEVDIEIWSNHIRITIKKGETKNIDLNYDGKYDISITILSIDNKNVEFTVKEFKKKSSIFEFVKETPEIGEESEPQEKETLDEIEEETFVEPKSANKGVIFGIITLILIVGIGYFYFKKDNKKKSKL